MKNQLLLVLIYLYFHISMNAQPLQLLPQNPHYFLYQGKPLVVVGSGEHYGAVMNLDFDYDLYIKTLQATGLNHTRLFTGAYYEKPGAFGIEHNTMAPNEDKLLLPWEKSGNHYDLMHFNGAYFDRLKDFMEKTQKAGIIVEITLFSAYYGAGWPYHPFNGNNNINGTPADLPAHEVNTLHNGNIIDFQQAYVQALVAALNAYDNFYFEIQNEPWAEGKDTVLVWNDYVQKEEFKIPPASYWKATLEVPSEASRQWHQRVSSWIVNAEKPLPKKHLISHNIANFKQPVYQSDPNISIYTFHYAFPEAVGLNYQTKKVIGCNETGFAGKSDETYRRQAWRFMFSGGGLFSHLDYSFSAGKEDGTDVTNNAPGGGSPALRQQFGVLKNYLSQLELATLHPDNTFLGHVEGAFAYPMKDARQWVVYLEPLLSKPATIRLIIPKGAYKIEWTDALTGAVIKTETKKAGTSPIILESPEGAGEKVLKIQGSTGG